MESYFDGRLIQLVGYQLLTFITILFTFGIAAPWAFCLLYKWETKHTVINGRRLRFDGTAMGLFGQWIKWLFLMLITCGIYGFWVNISLKKWKTKHTHFDSL